MIMIRREHPVLITLNMSFAEGIPYPGTLAVFFKGSLDLISG